MISIHNQKTYIGIYLAAFTVLDIILILVDSDYANELLYFQIPYVIWSAHVFERRLVYVSLLIISIINTLIVIFTLLEGNSFSQSSQALFVSTICTVTICELLYRSSRAKRNLLEKNQKLILELQIALTHVKTLKGLLPICSYCNKVKDDEGSWSKIEEYIRDHSEAAFTHSICPTCFERELSIINKSFQSKHSHH